jgi:hypothetical protein
VVGDNINTRNVANPQGFGEGKEREIFNQIRYVVQDGPAKDLSIKLRSSFLRTNNAVQQNGLQRRRQRSPRIRRVPDQHLLILI